MERFGGIQRLYGQKEYETLKQRHILVVGIGGVGSWVAEALARSGIEKITLVDLDDICITNTNRQIHALTDTVGKSKISVMAERIQKINPNCSVNLIADFFTIDTSSVILNTKYDFVVDAIDSLQHKLQLTLACKERNLPLIVCGAAGGRKDPTQVKIGDLTESISDPLLSKLRKRLRQKHNFPRKSKFKLACVYSTETPLFPDGDGCLTKDKAKAQNLKLDCETGLGTASFVTGTFGFIATSYVVEKLSAID